MTTFTSISNALVAVGAKPFATTVQALRDNPIAIAEDDPTAPKIRRRLLISNAAATTQTFIGLGDYSGVEFFIFATIGGSGSGGFIFSYSTDNGASFAATTIIPTGLVGGTLLKGAFDFATGVFRVLGTSNGGGPLFRSSLTISGASLGIDAVRFNTPGVSSSHVLTLHPNGGTV